MYNVDRAVILWLSGLRLNDVRGLPEVEMLMKQGAIVELEPSPITGPQAQHYQVLSGRSPASFGFFDTLVPRHYAVIEEVTGRGDTPKLLPDLLRTSGWTVDYVESQPSELVTSLQSRIRAASVAKSCFIIKCTISSQLPDVAQALRLAREWVGESGLLALLSDTQPVVVDQFVNVNNFLAEMGVIEIDGPGSHINWPNSLAYFAGHGQLWVNLLGRDVQGVVDPRDEYEEVCDTLIKELPNKLRNPETGEPVIERIMRKEEVFAGDYLFCAPDLVVLFKPGYAPSPRSMRIDFDEIIFTTPAADETILAGVHPSLLRGFLLASAPALAGATTATDHASLTAVVPTLLHALGISSITVEGSALGELFTPSYLEAHPIRPVDQNQTLSEEEEELVISRLRDLGYV